MDTLFTEQGLGSDWSVEVRFQGEFVGTILPSSDGKHYRYFQGHSKEIYVMEDHDLGALKDRIARKLQRHGMLEHGRAAQR